MDSNYKVTRFVTGPIETNSYVLSLVDQGEQNPAPCLVIDPSSGCSDIIQFVEASRLVPQAICCTHGHFDHIMGVEEIVARFPACEVWLHQAEQPLVENPALNGSFLIGENFSLKRQLHFYTEGECRIGGFLLTIFHIPGHSPGGCALCVEKHCFSGDSLFAGSIGRYDLPLSDGTVLVAGIQKTIMTLADNTIVYPGHGGRTTVGRERRQNPYLL